MSVTGPAPSSRIPSLTSPTDLPDLFFAHHSYITTSYVILVLVGSPGNLCNTGRSVCQCLACKQACACVEINI